MYSKALRHRGKIDVGVGKRRPDMRFLDAAAAPSGHRGQVHVFLVVGAIVLHDVEHRNTMVCENEQRVVLSCLVHRQCALATAGRPVVACYTIDMHES